MKNCDGKNSTHRTKRSKNEKKLNVEMFIIHCKCFSLYRRTRQHDLIFKKSNTVFLELVFNTNNGYELDSTIWWKRKVILNTNTRNERYGKCHNIQCPSNTHTHTHIWTIHKGILRCICYWIQCIEISYRWMGKSVIWLDFFSL